MEGQTARVCIDVVGATDIEITVGISATPVDTEGRIHTQFMQCMYF